MATIKDVAALAEVSVGTVSNYLNGKESINEEYRERIKAAIEVLEYRPNYMAQNLRYQKKKVIGLLFPSLDEPYQDIYEGIVDRLNPNDQMTVLKLTHNNELLENRFLEQLLRLGADGLIIISSDCHNPEKYQKIIDSNIPIVFLERKIVDGNFTYVLFDNKTLVYEIVTEILKRRPESDIRLFVGKQDYSCEKLCAEGFLLARPGRTEDIYEIDESARSPVFDHIFQILLDMDHMPDHFITSSMEYARLLRETCSLLHDTVPITVLVGENWYTTEIFQNIELRGRNAILMGKKAVNLLEQCIDSPQPFENQTILIGNKKDYPVPEVGMHILAEKKLNILAFQCDATNAMKKMSVAFTRSTGISVDFHELSYVKLKNELKAETAGESSNYNLYMIDIPWVRKLLEKECLVNLMNRVQEDGLNKLFNGSVKAAFYKRDIGIHYLPIINTTQILLYRRDVFTDTDLKVRFFRKNGFELSPPTTWANYNVIAEFFTRACNPSSPFEFGTAATALEPVGLINEFLPRQWAYRGQIVDKWGNLVIDSEENVRALESLKDTFRYIPKAAEDSFWDEIFEMLIKGKIPMAQGFASHYHPYKYSHLGNTYEKYLGAKPIPGNKGMFGGWALGINKYAEMQEEGYEFIRWNLNDRVAISSFRLGGCLLTNQIFSDETLRNDYPWLNLLDSETSFGRLREEVFNEEQKAIDPDLIDQSMSQGIRRAVHGEVDTQTALREIKTELMNLIHRR